MLTWLLKVVGKLHIVFHIILQSIYMNHSVDVNVRWLAVVCLKNGVDRYWRNNAPK